MQQLDIVRLKRNLYKLKRLIRSLDNVKKKLSLILYFYSSHNSVSKNWYIIHVYFCFMIVLQSTMPSDERRDDEKLYHKMTIGELQTKYPNVTKKRYRTAN